MIRRIADCGKWAAMVLLFAGSGGCSTWSDSLPLPESTLSREGGLALDLALGAPLQVQEDRGAKGEEGRQADGQPEEMEPATIPSQPEEAQAETGVEATPTVVAQADSSPFSNPVKPSETEGPGDVLRDPEPAKDENYDPFAKPGESVEFYNDPLEPFNRAMFTFNRKLDEYVLRPVAKVYEKVVPDGVEEGISNIFRNIRTAPRFFNNVFQGKFRGAGIEAGRLLINTSLGIGGFLDFAKEVFHLETPPEDTGQTFGFYGMRPGPYLVLPFLGSFTFRDGAGYIGDLALDPFNWLVFPIIEINGIPALVTHDETILFAQLGIRAGYMVNERALNIDTTFDDLEKSTADLYEAVRNAYLQKRAQAINE